VSAGSLSIQPFEGSPVWPSAVMGFECYSVGWARRKDTLPIGLGAGNERRIGGNAQEVVLVNVAESADGDTSSGRLGVREIFVLRKIDS
jgi:hypothetical protein